MQKFFVQKIVLLIDRFQTDAHCIVRFHKNVVSKFLAVVKVSYHSYYWVDSSANIKFPLKFF